MAAAMQFAYEEFASMQRQQTPPPTTQQQQQQYQQQQLQRQQQHQFHKETRQSQQHQASAPIPIPRPANMQIPSHYLQQQYMHHVSPHVHTHHQPLSSPLTNPPHLTASYTTHHNLPTLSAPYVPYDNSGVAAHMDQQQHQQQLPHRQTQHNMSSFEQNGNVEGELVLDCFVSDMTEI
jgi:hypothetical protein